MTKTCTKCGIEKPFDEFFACKRGKHGREARCKECRKAHARNKLATDPVARERNRQLCAARYRGKKLKPIGNARPADERFDEKLMPVPETGCLIWMGHTVGENPEYGHFGLNGKKIYAHRYAYWRHYGVIPKPEIHHKCENPLCCEPSHLLAVTREEHAVIHAND